MDLRSYTIAEAVVVELSGEHDISTVPKLEPAIAAAVDGQLRVVFDLSRCTYIDSTILALLVKKHRTFGDRMRVVVPGALQIRRVFAITKLDESLVIVETLAEAVGP